MSFIPDLPSVEVKRYGGKEGLDFRQLFHTLTVVKILRRFECSWSRLEALELNRYKACLDKMGIRMVAVAGDEADAKQYVEGGNWDGEFYIDEARALCRPKRPLNLLRSELSRLARKPKSGFRAGGTYIVAPDHRVVYLHHPRTTNEVPDIGLILYICRSWAYALKASPLTYDPVPDQASLSDTSSSNTPTRLSMPPQTIAQNFLAKWHKKHEDVPC